MITVIQLVSKASVTVDSTIVGAIDAGILALVGLHSTDTEQQAEQLLQKILNYRIFRDDQGKTNLNLKDIGGGLLLVPQFTLVAETQKGLRPGFSKGMPPEPAKILFEYFVHFAKAQYPHVESGQFGAMMSVALCNEGPMTFILSTE